MTNSRTAKVLASAAGLAMALSFAVNAGAVTVAELQAQVAALMAQISAMSGGSSSSYAFNTDLTVGSTGGDVVALQSLLISKGYLTMPAGVAQGYFGALTKSAVAKWQAASGIAPAAGYFGPKSRAYVNATGGVTGGTSTGGTVGSTGGATGITTPGAEGTITVTSAPVSTGTVYEGDHAVSILGFKVKAIGSDVAVQRVKIDLGATTKIYSKIYSKISLVDEAGNTVASSDLNSSTVVKNGSRYELTLSGFSSLVPKDATKTFTVKADVYSSIDSTDIAFSPFTVSLGTSNAVRAVDGAGIDQYAGDNTISKAISVSANLADTASLTLSTGASTPIVQEVIASQGAANNELDKVTLLTFDIKADKDSVLLTDLVATVTRSAGAATASSTYLYVDGNQIGSASATGSTATFADIDYTIPVNTTKTFTLKADIRSASTVQTTLVASVANSGLTAENSNGDTVTKSGSATGNSILVRSDGPIFTLVSKNITYSPAVGVAGATSTAKATFVINIKAVGNDVIFGTQAASSTFAFGVYKGSVLTTLLVSSSTSFTIPSTGVVTSGLSTGQAFKVSENGSADVSVDFIFEGRTTPQGVLIGTDAYAVGLENVKWSLTGNDTVTSSFMSGRTEWRTTTVTMP